jgi:SIT4-associating protein SAP185/190
LTSFPSYQFPLDNEVSSSPPFPRSSFTPPGSSSSNSSNDGDSNETIRRNVRLPLEIDDIDDDDDMGEMVAPSAESNSFSDSDDDFGGGQNNSKEYDHTSFGKSLGYPQFFGGGFGRRNQFDVDEGHSSSLHESGADERTDSSDGEDDGLVEILVPGRKTTSM